MFVALNEKHMHFYSHMTVDQSNSWPQMSAYSIQPKVFFQAYRNVSVKSNFFAVDIAKHDSTAFN